MIPGSVHRAALRCACAALFAFNLTGFAAQEYLEEDELFGDYDAVGSGRPIPDPFKGFNRRMFEFNDSVYVKLLKPVSRRYENAVPRPARRGIKNFFSNLKYPVRLAGNLLQFKFRRAGRETGRFLINTTIGLGGVLDPAKGIRGLNPPEEDIGQAFGRWGIGHGFYVVLPLLGPTTLRDGIGGIGDRTVHPISRPNSQVNDAGYRIGLQALNGINSASGPISVHESMMESAVDPYEALKDAYTQTRALQVQQ